MTATVLFIGAGVVIAAGLFAALGLPLLKSEADGTGAKSRVVRLAAVAFLALSPLIAALAYLRIGAPTLIGGEASAAPAPDAAAIAAMPEGARRAMIVNMVANLAARLEQSPDDPEGWRMLARSQMVLERPAESASSYRRLFALEPGTLEDWRNFATSLATAQPAGAFPTDPEFLAALDEIEGRAPGDAMALFFKGGAAREKGDPAAAAELWGRLLASMPAGAPARGPLETLIAEARADSVPK